MKRLAINLGKYLLGFGLLAVLIWRNWTGIATALERPLQFVPLILAVGCTIIGVYITLVRWFILVRAQELPFTFYNAVRLGLMGFFFSTFLPGSVGGDIVKATFLAREQSRRTVAVATVLVDRIIGLLGLFWLVALLGSVFWIAGSAALQQYVTLQWVVLGSYGVIACCLLGWIVLGIFSDESAEEIALAFRRRIPKIGGVFAELWRAVWMYRRKGSAVALTIGMSVLGHVFFVLSFYYSALIFVTPGSVDQAPNVTEIFLIAPVGMTIQGVFPTPSGLGGGEYSFGKLFELVGKPPANGVLTAVMARIIYWSTSFLGFLIYIQMGRVSVKEESEELVDAEAVAVAPAK